MSFLDDILADASERMDAAVTKVSDDFGTIRTGRANPALLNRISVDYYGVQTPLRQLANFAVPEPRILIVNPFDKGAVNEIERAIRESDLGVNPATDGAIIRCVFPDLTEERRRDFIKIAKQAAEDGKIALRNVRRSARDDVQSLEDEGEVGEDESRRYQDKIDAVTGAHVKKIDEMLTQKESDLLEV